MLWPSVLPGSLLLWPVCCGYPACAVGGGASSIRHNLFMGHPITMKSQSASPSRHAPTSLLSLYLSSLGNDSMERSLLFLIRRSRTRLSHRKNCPIFRGDHKFVHFHARSYPAKHHIPPPKRGRHFKGHMDRALAGFGVGHGHCLTYGADHNSSPSPSNVP